MTDRLAPIVLLAVLTFPSAAPAQPAPRAEGSVESDEGRAVILGRVWRKGDVVELPEGFLRVEEDPRPGEERGVGSFTVVAASPEAFAATGSGAEPVAGAAVPRGTSGGDAVEEAFLRAPRCREERGAYLAELWRSWGIEVEDPSAFLDGLTGGDARVAAAWLGLASDPVRPLAGSSELRRRANALAACARLAR